MTAEVLVPASKLVAEKRWIDLRSTALAMRNEPNLQTVLDGYSLFLTGLADQHLRRTGAAGQSVRKA